MDKLDKILKGKIKTGCRELKEQLSDETLEELYSVYPFNKFEYIISHLISGQIIDINEYLSIRSSYINRNKYLYLFEITAPRTFGETWAQRHLNEIVPELQRQDKTTDPKYTGEYDFWYNNIKIEVKASRAVRRQSGGRLIEKALSIEDNASFDMNFQQLKPDCCDVFVWIGVWKDCIKYWVLSNEEVRSNKYFSKGQHRGNKQKEGQLWIKNSNIDDFNLYAVDVRHILDKIIEKSNQHTHCHE